MPMFSATALVPAIRSQTALAAAATDPDLRKHALTSGYVHDELWLTWYGKKPALADAKLLVSNIADSPTRLRHVLAVEKRAAVIAGAIEAWADEATFPTDALEPVLDLPRGLPRVITAADRKGLLRWMQLDWVARAAQVSQDACETYLDRPDAEPSGEQLYALFANAEAWLSRKRCAIGIHAALGNSAHAARGALASGQDPLLSALAGARTLYVFEDDEHRVIAGLDSGLDAAELVWRWLAYVNNPFARLTVIRDVRAAAKAAIAETTRWDTSRLHEVLAGINRRLENHPEEEVRVPMEEVADLRTLSWLVRRTTPYRDPEQVNRRTATDLAALLANPHLTADMVNTLTGSWMHAKADYLEVGHALVRWLEKYPEADDYDFAGSWRSHQELISRKHDPTPPVDRPAPPEPTLTDEQADQAHSTPTRAVCNYLEAHMPQTVQGWLMAYKILGRGWPSSDPAFQGTVTELVAVAHTLT